MAARSASKGARAIARSTLASAAGCHQASIKTTNHQENRPCGC